MNKNVAILSTILMFSTILIPFSTVNASTFFQEDFETGDLSNWSGHRSTTGETIGVSTYRSYTGTYGGRATSNGDGGVEYAYCYKTIAASELTAQASFYVSKSGIVENGDRIYLMSLQSGSNTLATVGWRQVDGLLKWFVITRDGLNSVIAYSEESPELNMYYNVALYWKKDSANGGASLWVSKSEEFWIFQPCCHLVNKNTAAYGDASEARIGLPTISYCGDVAVYFDKIMLIDGSSGNPAYPLYSENDYGLVYGGFTEFEDGFETGNFAPWSGTNTYNGGNAQITNIEAQSGTYSAQFTTDGSTRFGQAYCYKLFPEGFNNWGNTHQFYAYFKVTACDLAENGKILLIRAWNQNTEVITAGLTKLNGTLYWFEKIKTHAMTEPGVITEVWATLITPYSAELNQWYSLGAYFAYYFYWNFEDATVTCEYPFPIDRIDIGLTKLDNCGAASVYVDTFNAYVQANE